MGIKAVGGLPTILGVGLFIYGCHGCDAVEGLTRVCPDISCWVDDDGNIRTDAPSFVIEGAPCHLGTVTCDENKDIVACAGFVGPTTEVCNNKDDDCNGLVDEFLDRPWGYGNNGCAAQALGVCKIADRLCIDGVEVCQPIIGPTPEKCDGLDNDCDGEVDEGLEVRYSYPEDLFPNTVGVGECRPRIDRCVNGQNSTIYAVVPSTEQCGTMRDEDCDGLTDEYEGGPLEGHFALVIDISGSMAGFIESVAEALCDWSSDPTFSWSTFAVIIVSDNTVPEPFVSIVQDFEDAGTTCASLYDLFGMSSNGFEYQPAGILLSENLSWPGTGSNHVIVFSDEELQVVPEATVADVQESCRAVPYDVGVFTKQAFYGDWYDVTSSCGGFIDYLDDNPAVMADSLRMRFVGGC